MYSPTGERGGSRSCVVVGEVEEPRYIVKGSETDDVRRLFVELEESTAKGKGTEKGNQLLRYLPGL